MKPQFCVIDIETTGLDILNDCILEIGVVLYDIRLDELASYSVMITDDVPRARLDLASDLVKEMHHKSGLTADIDALRAAGSVYNTIEWASASVAEFLVGHGLGRPGLLLPMTGSSVHFDRKFLEVYAPVLAGKFSHRNIDVSTLKGLVDIYRQDVADERNANVKPKGNHRVLDDCRDTAQELQFYLERTLARG